MRRLIWVVVLLGIAASCTLDGIGLQLAPGWKLHSLAAWRDTKPEKLALSEDGRWLYLSCRNKASLLAASLIAIDLEKGRHVLLLSGLHQADALKLAPDGSLWIGEDFAKGLIWRIAEPDRFPEDQRVDRGSMDVSHPAITPLSPAGAFAHQGLAFSGDGRFAYMTDGWQEGCLFRFDMRSHSLAVMHADKGWLPVGFPEDARVDAERLHAHYFDHPSDLEMLPDGRLLIAEKGSGRILVVDDHGDRPELSTFLTHADLAHPDNLAWDKQRQWLWITDQDQLSRLWAWDGTRLIQVASHDKARITGVLADHGTIYLNLQRRMIGAEITLKIEQVR